jgi:hypothetical protein
MTKEKIIEVIKNRIISEHRKHQNLDWEDLAAHKIYYEISNEILNNYSLFLEENGYLDIDWRTEKPFAIDEFMKGEKK